MKDNAWFKTYYKIVEWGWFQDAKTFQVFIYLIARASIVQTEFMGVTVERGQVVTSYPSIAKATGSSIQEVRTAIKHLKSTGEITVTVHPKFSLITVQNYDKYQTHQQGKQQSANSQLTGNQQAANTIIRIKEDKKIRRKNKRASPVSPSARGNGNAAEDYLPEDWEVEHVPKKMWNRFRSLAEWKKWNGDTE